ncbi:hypothetical protein C2E20_7298 [Micractinium conductrix]|uniref:Tyrosine specific protein phosphatases domain-containing protein n=1 Tax=Micractinium conductrix TaxID=554055 RepID=A0A2P6V4W8_9CHLO|nr:hypothetical protein C2E20_7298 [Micractinium conductrix]|eukprot:PSC69127.1 hypothetical protein C2E20_7298 [Micractinium conductrix]
MYAATVPARTFALRSPAPRSYARPSVRAMAAASEPTINFDRVSDSIVVGSCLRNAADAQKAKEAGVAVVFSLQDATDLSAQGIDADAVAAACEAAGVKHVRCPTGDADEVEFRSKLPGAVAAFASAIAAAGAAGGTAYAHCNGGRGRAPTISTAYLFWLGGMSLADAAATMTAGRKSQPKMGVISGATADLLGLDGEASELSGEQRAGVEVKLKAMILAGGRRGAAARRPAVCSAAPAAGTDFEALQTHSVYSAATGEKVQLSSLWPQGSRCVVACLTHFADLSSIELAQKLLPALSQLQAAGVGFVAVGLGEPEKARRFSELLGFPLDCLYADPTGELYTALGFSPGFLPEANVSAYAKLLPMLAGIGSPGTLQEVLRGYFGDRNSKPVFSGASNLFDVLGSGYQRPFELATLRLFNMQLVLTHWKELAPVDERLLTQQGGVLVFEGSTTMYKHSDAGILRIADVEEVLAAALPAGAATEALPAQVQRGLMG